MTTFTPWTLLQWVSALALSAFIVMFLIFAILAMFKSLDDAGKTRPKLKGTDIPSTPEWKIREKYKDN